MWLSENRIRIIPSVNYAVPATHWNWTPWYLQFKWKWPSPNYKQWTLALNSKEVHKQMVENSDSMLTKSTWGDVRISQHEKLTENMFIFGSKNLILLRNFYRNMLWKFLLITLFMKKINSKYYKPRISLKQSFVCCQYCTQ